MKDMPAVLPCRAASMSVMSCRAVLLAARRSLKAWYLVLKTERISSIESAVTGSPPEKILFSLWNRLAIMRWSPINLSPDPSLL
jgi:hypothetical protein